MNILDLLQEKGISPKKAAGTHGGEYHSPCPRCGGRDRFHVWPDQNPEKKVPGSYWCRVCDKGGDAITFLIEHDGLTYPEACERLGQAMPQRMPYRLPKPQTPAGQSKPYSGSPDPHNKPPEKTVRQAHGHEQGRMAGDLPPALWREKAEVFVAWAADHLMRNSRALAILKKRGIKKDTARRHRLGWNPGDNGKDLFRPRESWGLDTTLNENGRKKALWFPRGLVIPLLGPVDGSEDTVLRIRIRTKEGRPPYYVLPGSNMDYMVFNLERRAAVTIESELDGILIEQEAADLAGILALGTASSKPHAGGLLFYRLLQIPVLLLAHDFDDAGRAPLTWWFEHFPQAERWPVPRGKDPGEAYEAGVDIRQWLQSGLPPGWFLGPSGQKKQMGESGNDQVEQPPGPGEPPPWDRYIERPSRRGNPCHGAKDAHPRDPGLGPQKLGDIQAYQRAGLYGWRGF